MSRLQHVSLNAYAHTFPPDGRQVWVVNWQIQAGRQSRTKGVIGSITFTSFNSFSDIENQQVFIGFSLPERQSEWTAAQDLLSRKPKNGVFQLKVDCLACQNWLSCSLTLTILQPKIDYLAASLWLSWDFRKISPLQRIAQSAAIQYITENQKSDAQKRLPVVRCANIGWISVRKCIVFLNYVYSSAL